MKSGTNKDVKRQREKTRLWREKKRREAGALPKAEAIARRQRLVRTRLTHAQVQSLLNWPPPL